MTTLGHAKYLIEHNGVCKVPGMRCQECNIMSMGENCYPLSALERAKDIIGKNDLQVK